MSWISGEDEARRRPVVLVEDHLAHVEDVLELLAQEAPEWIRLVNVVCLDRPGPDTQRAVQGWLGRHEQLCLAAAVEVDEMEADEARLVPLAPEVFDSNTKLVKAVAGLLRSGGLLLQDVQLDTLAFIPRQRWWESIFLAATVRGTFAERPPSCRFLSNKRGYEATFGRDLMEAGFDPRDVLDKNQLDRVLIPTLKSFLASSMPLELRLFERGRRTVETVLGPEDRPAVDAHLDLVLWQVGETVELGGAALRKERQRLKASSPEAETWSALVAELFAGGKGLAVLDVGARVAPELAGRAEITNCAARHVHTLRSRLKNGTVLRTIEHAYRLDQDLRVGWVTDRFRSPEGSSH